ncbi:MAG: hypothetical protein OXI87_05110 [Albidovulum sp.]|nr:hypothetical protein [Albidovulum sp.]
MQKATRGQFEELRLMLKDPGNKGECPIWLGSCAGTIQTGGDVTDPKHFWSPLADGVFTIPAGTPILQLQVPDDETRKRISS